MSIPSARRPQDYDAASAIAELDDLPFDGSANECPPARRIPMRPLFLRIRRTPLARNGWAIRSGRLLLRVIQLIPPALAPTASPPRWPRPSPPAEYGVSAVCPFLVYRVGSGNLWQRPLFHRDAERAMGRNWNLCEALLEFHRVDPPNGSWRQENVPGGSQGTWPSVSPRGAVGHAADYAFCATFETARYI